MIDKELKGHNPELIITDMTWDDINEAVAWKLGKIPFEKSCGVCEKVIQPEDKVLPDYCRSIKAAWEIVEYVGKHSSWSMYWLGGPDEKKFWRVAILGSEYVDANTVSEAICIAFLKLP